MPAKFIMLLMGNKKLRGLFITAVIILLAVCVGAAAALPLLITAMISFSVFPTDNTNKVHELVTAIDAARAEYIQEQVTDGYFMEKDPNNNDYKNKVFQWQDCFSNNDKEIISAAACYYQQDWDGTDFTPLCQLMALRSITITVSESAPYSCSGCVTTTSCNGHDDGNGGLYYHADTQECSDYSTSTSCPGNHYDLIVTAANLGWDSRNDSNGAVHLYCGGNWSTLTDSTHGDSEVMNKYADAFAATSGNPDWQGWVDVDVDWAENICMQDWQELYGITIVQTGVQYGGSVINLTDEQMAAVIGSGELSMPITSYSYISCWYGEPDAYGKNPHHGMDFAAAGGTPILAAGNGVVVEAKYHSSWGNYVKLYNGTINGIEVYTLYAHASALYVSAGQTVIAGQQIAAVGSTGDSTGNHLHFEVYAGGAATSRRTDPAPWIGISR